MIDLSAAQGESSGQGAFWSREIPAGIFVGQKDILRV